VKLYDVLKLIDSSSIELPLYVDDNGDIPCEPQSVFKVTLRFMAEDETAVTVPISSPLLIPWYDCPITAINPNDVEDSMDVWLDYSKYVIRKWKSKIEIDKQNYYQTFCDKLKDATRFGTTMQQVTNSLNEKE
jgi:hypothetical protein